jgi:hypothetical protein
MDIPYDMYCASTRGDFDKMKQYIHICPHNTGVLDSITDAICDTEGGIGHPGNNEGRKKCVLYLYEWVATHYGKLTRDKNRNIKVEGYTLSYETSEIYNEIYK